MNTDKKMLESVEKTLAKILDSIDDGESIVTARIRLNSLHALLRGYLGINSRVSKIY